MKDRVGNKAVNDVVDFNKEYVYGHKMCLVTHKRSFVRPNEMGDVDYGQERYYIKHEGVYCFGGMFGKGATDRRMSSKLFFMPVGTIRAKFQFRELECLG